MATFFNSEKGLVGIESITPSDIEEILEATVGPIKGMDTEDREYDGIVDLWNFELVPKSRTCKDLTWYSKAFDYWESEANCPLDDNGVLGGYGKLTPVDTRDSNLFLDALSAARPQLQFEVAADCGAGIGRVTKHLLLPRFKTVDLIEQSPRLLAASVEYIGEGHERTNRIVEGLQAFNPSPNSYDVIWIQWVIGHLHDVDFIHFFRRCAAGLRPGGVIILKDNCAQSWTFVVDKQDSSLSRSLEYMHVLMNLAGLNVVMETRQTDFPSELYPVYMTALVPAEGS